jgi:hypothetical protein
MKVYPVSKKKVQEDYHSNIDGPRYVIIIRIIYSKYIGFYSISRYMIWWKLLNEQVRKEYGPSIIVIDNGKYE